MSEQIFECDPSGWVLTEGDDFHAKRGYWSRVDQWMWSLVGSDAHYNGNPKNARRLYGKMGGDERIIPIGRLVDTTDTPHYRVLTDAERKGFGLNSEPEPAPTVSAPQPNEPEVDHEWQFSDGVWTLFMSRVRYKGDRVIDQLAPLAVVAVELDGAYRATVLIPFNHKRGDEPDQRRNTLREALDWCEGELGLSDEAILIVPRSQFEDDGDATP